jgi:hypothetical protein
MRGPVTPDLVNKLQGYMASGMGFFGQPITLRRYISASAGNPEMGLADRLCYQDRPSMAELRMLSLEEAQVVGGQDIRGTYEMVTTDPVTLRDQVVYLKESYRLLSEPERQIIGETLYYKSLIQRASITGFY